MNKAAEILSEVERLSESGEFINRHKANGSAFSRKRKLSVRDIMLFVLTLPKTTQPFALSRYTAETKQQSVAAGSMTKARSKLVWSAFREVLCVSAAMAFAPRRFKGYRLIAIDGMQGDLPRTEELLTKYPPEEGARIPKFHAVSAYDVLNKTFLDAEFLPFPCDEREAAMALIRSLSPQEGTILIFDRGFPSIRLMQLLEELQTPYVMRVSKSFLVEVNRFTQSDATDAVIDIRYTNRRAKISRVRCDSPWNVGVRAVKIPLPHSGEDEILLTSLPNLSADDLAEIYRLRWGIETGHNYLKNAVAVEEFMGTLENSVKQEFYASLFVYNLTSLLCEDAKALGIKKLQI